MEYIKLNNGVLMPHVGYGTYQTPARTTEQSVREALDAGYRLIDTAQCYGNEKQVGLACRKSGIPREELFITTKLWACHGYEDSLRSIADSLAKIDMDYIDLLLIHEPSGNVHEIYRAMETMYRQGYFRAIGVSNFLYDNYLELVNHCKVIPAVNQVETHVFRQQKELRELELQIGTIHEAWSPLACGQNGIFSNPILKKIGERHNKTVAQVALRYLYNLGVVIIPKSTKRDRMEENMNIFDFQLSGDEMEEIESLEVGKSFFDWW